ncbi:(deoxy)nucleoside triphosphate pyrophosphohydrolase [Microbacterium mangrovi]|uniref:(deoxy)nucleoside triphosphate pyrophosphohydrolase n=1 Tax=Microbacterium mangrovi TaxID=1348253 RepID=UPI0009DFA95B|nr:(deoxy)nucleoside triphosphate pyrophosphohydrolase [Microbacterium mangrovi]
MASTDHPVRVVAAVITRGDEVLACRRNADKSFGGRWEFPGGKLEPGESLSEALVREIREELDVQIEVGEELTTDVTTAEGLAIRLTCFRAFLGSTPPDRSTDHDAMRWVSVSALPTLDWAPADWAAVRYLQSLET